MQVRPKPFGMGMPTLGRAGPSPTLCLGACRPHTAARWWPKGTDGALELELVQAAWCRPDEGGVCH